MKLKVIIWFGCIMISLALPRIHVEREFKFEWEFIANFMEDQYVVALFVEQNYEDYGHRLLKYSIQKFQFGVFYYNNVTLISQFWESFKRIAMYTERIYGVIIISRNFELIEILMKISGNNKAVIILFDEGVNEIKQVMKIFWDKHRSFNMITVSIRSNETSLIILQNPFRSQFFEYPIDKITSSKNFVAHLQEQYRRFILNMHGHQLKLYIFEFPFISMPIMNKAGHVIGYTGMHGTMLKMMRQLMNFTPIFVRETVDAGSMFGLSSARIIEHGQAELGLNGRFILGEPFNNTVYLYPMDKVTLKFIVPINYEEEPLEIFAYNFFDSTSRICIALCLTVVTSLWLLGIYLFKNNIESATSAIPFKVFALIHSISVQIPNKLFNRIIFITIAFFGLLLGSVYQGMVVKRLSTPFKPLQIKTLNDLLRSNLDIAVITYTRGKIEKNSTDYINNLLIMGDIGRKPVMKYDQIKEGLDVVAYNKTTALLMPTMFFNPFAVKYFNKTTGLDLLHSITEPPTTMFISYAIARNSPYINTFNRILRISIENGIMRRDIAKASYNQHLFYIRRIKNGYIPEEQKKARPITLSDVVLLKYFLAVGTFVSAIVFLLENFFHFVLKC